MNKTDLNILVFGLRFPEPKSTAAGSRMLQLIKVFQDFGFHIHFACAQPKSKFAKDLNEIKATEYVIQLNDNTAQELLKTLRPEVVMFDRFITEEQFGWVVDETCPHALKVLDTEDLHFLRENRERIVKNPSTNIEEYRLTDKAKREIASIYRSDLSLMISKTEIEILSNQFRVPHHMLVYLPFLFNTDRLNIKDRLNYADRKHFASIGNFKHAPNLDMVKHLRKTIWPQIKTALPNAEWHIYGAYMPQQIKEMHEPAERIIVKGRAEEAVDMLQHYKVMLAPLRFGAGLKGKCFDSMRAGTPSATTTIGSEGITEAKKWPGIVSDDVEQFSGAAVELYQNPKLWESKQRLCYELLKAKFNINDFKHGFKIKIEQALEKIQELRKDNPVGEILKYHQHRSTKYMSLWIQEKNK